MNKKSKIGSGVAEVKPPTVEELAAMADSGDPYAEDALSKIASQVGVPQSEIDQTETWLDLALQLKYDSRVRFGPEGAVHALLLHIGEDPARDGLKNTPTRVVRALTEMTSGYQDDPARILGTVFQDPHDELIIVTNIPFVSLCEHHMLIFSGTVDVGYIPGKVVGLSKLPRLVDCFSKRLQIQEKMTRQIAESIREHLQAKGVGVVVRAIHSCMSCRGVRKTGATMITSCMLGVMMDKPEARAEFMSLIGG